MPSTLPPAVLSALTAEPGAAVVDLHEERAAQSTGAATGQVVLLTAVVRTGVREVQVRVARKAFEPLTEGPHAALASDPRHWAYWRREIEAYRSALLPSGPGLRSPRCFAVVDDEVYLEVIEGPPPSALAAAAHLATWQCEYTESLDQPWLATDQLGRRLAVTALDWRAVDADARLVRLWDRREELYASLAALPLVLSHGDYSLGNLVASGSDTVAIDWATIGWEPVGFDLAHLALSAGEDPTTAYIEAMPPGRLAGLRTGFAASVALIGASRMHWMLARRIEPPSWYADFVAGMA